MDVVAGDEKWFLSEAAKAKVIISHVIDTHIHADHYSGSRALAKLAGAKYCLHESNQGVVQFEFHALTDNETIAAGNVAVKVLHTPGHTGDSVCLQVTDQRRGEMASARLDTARAQTRCRISDAQWCRGQIRIRSEEHTSELQSPC